MEKIFVMNLGGSSSKIAVFYDEELKHEKTFRHSSEEMRKHATNDEQVNYRYQLMEEWLEEIGEPASEFTAIAVRAGGLPHTVTKAGGTYLIDDGFRKIILDNYEKDAQFFHGIHVSLPIALKMINGQDTKIFVTDPPTVTEFLPVAKVAGHPKFERRAVFHALNQKAAARKVADKYQVPYGSLNMIVTHLGAGISVAAHKNGKVIDVNNNTTGDGPMAPTRAGQLPMGQLVETCFSGEYTKEEVMLMVRGKTGVEEYLGTADMRDVEKMIEDGNEEAKLIRDAMIYQVAKEIGSLFAVFEGKVDYLVFTGGMAHSKTIMDELIRMVGSFGKVEIVPGEYENEGLALGALRVLRNEEQAILSK